MVTMRENNIPASIVNEVISSDKNGVAIMMNYLVKENLYFFARWGTNRKNTVF